MTTALTNGTTTHPRPAAHHFAPIAADLEEVEHRFAAELAGHTGHAAELIRHLRHYRGKRLRPALLLLTARACGRVTPNHHILAAVVEMIHTATLVHDDVLDEAAERRHSRTVNHVWGNKASILLGDLLFSHAYHLASTTGDAEACRLIGAATNRVCAGELQQIGERGNLGLGESAYFEMIDGKTAELTACACKLGALYAGASAEVVEAMEGYGRRVGLAFQIADDVLDLVGEEAAAGKTLGTDLDQQKLTLPVIRLLERSPAAEAERVRQILRGPAGDRRARLVPLLTAGGAVAYARRRADEFAVQARAALEHLPASECREVLARLAEWAVRRER
jgi:octaprenyl-diphosphate synthase